MADQNSDPSLEKLVGDLPHHVLKSQLSLRGYTGGAETLDRSGQEFLLTQALDAEQAIHASGNSRLWTIMAEFPKNSGVVKTGVFFQWKDSIILVTPKLGKDGEQSLGTFSVSLRNGLVETLETTGEVPQFLFMFSKRPVSVLVGDTLYLMYQGTGRGCGMCSLNLNKLSWKVEEFDFEEALVIQGSISTDQMVSCTFAGEGGTLVFLISEEGAGAVNFLHEYDVTACRLISSKRLCNTENAPRSCWRSKLVIRNTFICFSESSAGGDQFIHFLDLETLSWSKERTEKNKAFSPSRHNQTLIMHGDSNIIFISKDTGCEIFAFNLSSRRWQRIVAHGKRPTAYLGEAMFLLVPERDLLVTYCGYNTILDPGEVEQHYITTPVHHHPNLTCISLKQRHRSPSSTSSLPPVKLFRSLFEDEELKDVVLRGKVEDTPSEETVSAHRAVLSARSEYFRNLFRFNQGIAVPGKPAPAVSTVTIPGVHIKYLRAAVLFCYDLLDLEDLISDEEFDLGSLLIFAAQHLMVDLQNVVASYLVDTATVESAPRIFSLFAQDGVSVAQETRDRLSTFFLQNYASISSQESFMAMITEESAIGIEAMKAICSVPTPPKYLKTSHPEIGNPLHSRESDSADFASSGLGQDLSFFYKFTF